MDNVAKGLAPVYLYLLRKLQMKLSSTRSFKPFCSLALERRTISLFIPTRLEYDFPGYSSYAGPRYYGFKQKVGNSVKLRAFSGQKLGNSIKLGALSGFRHVVALSNSIDCNIQLIYPLISNTLVKRKHFLLFCRLHTSSE